MLKIIAKENRSILFTEDEYSHSVLLKTMFLNEDMGDDEETEEKVIHLQNISITSLSRIKVILRYVVKHNVKIKTITNNQKNEIEKYIKIKETFQLKDFFEMINSLNYLHIDIILKPMISYLKNEIRENSIDDVKKKFDVCEDDFNEQENARMNIFKNIIYED
tara:strand:+ start:4133 stop:4621 length:489 start_codon:yes stop_codon:yes gene_type:complete